MEATTTANHSQVERSDRIFADLLGFSRYCQGDGLVRGSALTCLPGGDSLNVSHYSASMLPMKKGVAYRGDNAFTAADVAARINATRLVEYGLEFDGTYFVRAF